MGLDKMAPEDGMEFLRVTAESQDSKLAEVMTEDIKEALKCIFEYSIAHALQD